MKKIMILGASILQLPAILKAEEMGLSVIAVDMNPDAVGFKENGVIKEVVSTIDIPAVIEVAKKHQIDGVMTLASDMPMRTVAAVAREMGLIGITDDTALKATNKACMREALKKHGVPVPAFYKVSDKEEYIVATSEFTVPFIVKPADNSGSRGIVKISDLQDKTAIADAYEYSRKYSRNGDVVVEEYMNGPEVSVETITVNGKCHVIQITDKLTTGAPHFVEMRHSQPSCLDNETKEKIKQVATAANKAIGITNGPSHTEIIVTSEGPKIVELGARLGGDCITTHLVPLSTGVDMVESCIRIALGEKPDIDRKIDCGSAIRYFPVSHGTIRNISNLDHAKSIPGIKQISFVHGIGERIDGINSSSDRIGFVIAQADTVETAVKIAEMGVETVRIEMS